jgi:hypothetical protein
VDVRHALAAALLLAICAPCGAFAQQAKPQDVAVGPVTLQIVETEIGEKELRHGTRVLVKDYLVSQSLAAKFKDTHARVFDVGPGGNACDGWPAVVTVGKDGTAAINTTMKGLCSLFAASADEEGFTFVERAMPDQAGSVWRFTPEAGMRRLGLLVFRPQPNSTWNDLEKSLDHPLTLFEVAPFDAAVRKLTGSQYNDFTLRLRVAGGVEKKGNFLIGSGCQPHACNSDQGFIAVDRKTNDVFLAMRRNERLTTWPALSGWREAIKRELASWRKN